MSKLFDLATATIEALVAGWPDPITDLPERRYVSNGTVIWDCCEQLAVMVERTYGMDADVASEQFVSSPTIVGIRACTLGIWIVREAPDIDSDGENPIFPTATAIEANAGVVLDDAEAVFKTLLGAFRRGEYAGCMGLAFEQWTSEGQEGGFVGGVTRVRVALV